MYSLRYILFLLGFFIIPYFSSASVVINEILFDPAGTDTGLEKIELYNPDDGPADVSNFELYPDGIGYFVFPAGFSLASKSFLTIHLRISGTDDAKNLYHSSVSGNMGNSSGSVAIFKPGGRSQDTVVDFVRYHKSGVSERKTWESAAVGAGLWTAGEFVDIASLGQGSSIGLVTDGSRSNALAWKIFPMPTIDAGNSSPASPPSSSTGTTTPLSSQTLPALRPSLGADAGSDVNAIAGTTITFRGTAYGLDGGPLPSARFLWNFGDGEIKEGRSLIHVYRFPGIYKASLSVSSGEYSGSDWRTISVIPSAVIISEVRPGQDGFVELFNASPEEVDLGGLSLIDDAKNAFSIPPGTIISGQGSLVLASVLTSLRPLTWLVLRDAAMNRLDVAELRYAPVDGSSYERSGESFVLRNPPTPGQFSEAKSQTSKPKAASARPQLPALSPPPEQTLSRPAAEVFLPTTTEILSPAAPTPASPLIDDGKNTTMASFLGVNIFFALSLGLGLLAAIAFWAVKRILPL